jgi:tetratricopeptide (TPR) repeat protein
MTTFKQTKLMKNLNIRRRSLTVLLVCMLFLPCKGQVSIREEAMNLTTYPFGDPDPVAHPSSAIYPYFTFDGYAHQGKPQSWKTVVLENEYIRVTVVPAIGGKIWSAEDKSTGHAFIYHNHVVKFRNISMRGPWTSGGIEPNFGIIGHAPSVATPVDYYTRTNDDGSVSCFVSSLELISRTWWQVEINLPRDKAYFTTTTTWHNNTAIARPYYHWMNAAYYAADDLEFFFPGQYYIGHDGISCPWHTDSQGRDLSKYAVHTFGGDKSFHVLGNYNDFYAAYYKDRQFGSVHFSPFNDKLGMKIFIWGLSRQGMIWEDLLTDSDGQYVELQSGRLYNQAAPASQHTPFKQFAFEPFATDVWTEYWYPVKETGGIVKANEWGALNVVKENRSATISFSPVQKINDDIVVVADGKEIFSKRLSLDVLQTWQETVPLHDRSASIKVVLGDKQLIYSDHPADNRLSRPVASPEDFNENSAYGLYLQGEQEMYRNQYATAEQLLKQSLLKEPFFIPALRDLATIHYARGNDEAADSCARMILSINTYDPDGNLLHGLANSRMGHAIDAVDGFKTAALSPSHRSAAYTCLAIESAKENDWRQVLQHTAKSLASNTHNPDAIQLQAVACRKSGKTKEANDLIIQIEKTLPLNHYARFEKYLLTHSEQDKSAFLGYIRNELPHETFMEMAGWYERINCTEEALSLYAFIPDYPVASYRAAYLLFDRGEAGYEAMLKHAESGSAHFVFPFRSENIPALEWAVKQSDNWINKYYLGILYAFLGQEDKAAELFELCGNPGEAFFYLTRAQYRQGERKTEDFLSAERSEPSWRTGMAMIRYYQETEQYEKMHAIAKKYVALFPDNEALKLKYAVAMLYRKEYRRCTELLAKIDVLPQEGAHEGRRIYREAWLFLALDNIRSGKYAKALSQIDKSRLWPENIGVGKPYDEDIDTRAEDYMSAHCHEKMNKKKQAAAYHERVKQGDDRFSGRDDELFDRIRKECR